MESLVTTCLHLYLPRGRHTIISHNISLFQNIISEKITAGTMFIFNAPTTMSISGTTGSGKTTWVLKLMQHSSQMFSLKPQKILYCYGIWQELFNTMEKLLPNIIFHEGLPTSNTIKEFADNKHNIIILDDLMSDCVKNKDVELLFTRGAHHMNLTILYLNQNMFCQGKHARNIALNCHYMVLFQNLRDSSQINKLGQQIFPGESWVIMKAYKDCLQKEYGYLVVDVSPNTKQIFRLRTQVFPGEATIIFSPHGSE